MKGCLILLQGLLWRTSAAGFVIGLVSVGCPTSVTAQALRFQPQGAVAAAQGNAFAAQADDASAIHYNPAGLAQVSGVQGVFGLALLGGSIKTKSIAGEDSRGDFGGSVSFPPPGHTYLSANLGALGASRFSAMTIGLGMTSPFGLRTRFPLDGPFNTTVTSAELPLIAIKPTIAYKISSVLSVGISADIYTFASFLGEGHVEQKRISAAGGTSVELNGTGTGAGVTVSTLYSPFLNSDGRPTMSIGLVYRSLAVLPLKGSLLVHGAKVADASTDLVLPHIFTGAIALWPIRSRAREWKVELNVEYVGWSSNRNFDVHLSNGSQIPGPQQWKDVLVVAVGTEYKWLNPAWLPHWDVAVRSGYTHTQDPVPSRTFNPGVISLSSHALSFGVGFVCTGTGRFLGMIPCRGETVLWPKGIGIDLAYQEWFYESRTIIGNVYPTVDGTYHAFVHLGTFSLKFLY